MGILTTFEGFNKRKNKTPSKGKAGRQKQANGLSTDLILPAVPSPARAIAPALVKNELIIIEPDSWKALKLEAGTHLRGERECTLDQLATALKASVSISNWEKHEESMEKLTGKMESVSLLKTASTGSVRQGLTKLEQAPESQEKTVATVDEAMEALKAVFIVKDEDPRQSNDKRPGSFMGVREYSALIRTNLSKRTMKGFEKLMHRLHGAARASAKGDDDAEQSTLDKSDAEHKEATQKEYKESKIRALPKALQDAERERIADEERAIEARNSAASLLRALTDEEQQVVNHAIYGLGRNDDVLAKIGPDSVLRESMHRLQPGQWLNDEVVHFFYSMLAVRDQEFCKQDPSRKPCHFFKSFFMTKLLNEGHPTMDGQYEYRQVKRWSKLVPGKDLFALDKIFFPINQGFSHWICAVVYMKEKRIQMYDSLHGPGMSYLEAIFRYLKDDYKDKKGGEMPDKDEWELVVTQGDTPNQHNGMYFNAGFNLSNVASSISRTHECLILALIGTGFDCGVFTCMFADFISKNCPLVFSQQHITQCRERIALSIMNGSALM